MNFPGVRLRRWKSPAHLSRVSMSSSASSSQLVLPSLIAAAISSTSVHIVDPHFFTLIFSALLALGARARACTKQGA